MLVLIRTRVYSFSGDATLLHSEVAILMGVGRKPRNCSCHPVRSSRYCFKLSLSTELYDTQPLNPCSPQIFSSTPTMYISDSGKPSRHVRPTKVICIGAGLAGIAAAYKYMHDVENAEFVIYEKNQDVGGTWLENRYPGCACDIPAHGYTFSWEGNPKWSRL